MKTTKRIVSLLLTVLMLLTSAPLVGLTAAAAGDNTDLNIDFSYSADNGITTIGDAVNLQAKGTASTKTVAPDYYASSLNKYKWRHPTKLTLQGRDSGSLRYYLESENAEDTYIALTQDVTLTKYGPGKEGSTEWKTMTITKDKVLDLNGHKIQMNYNRNVKGTAGGKSNSAYFQSNDPDFHNCVMFTITKGATLTIIDSSMSSVNGRVTEGKGSIGFNGYMVYPFDQNSMDFYTTRDLFHVDWGNLVIYGGTFTAGRAKEQVKKNFSWSGVRDVIGNAVELGTAIAEYASGISAAKANLADVNEAVLKDLSDTKADDRDGGSDGAQAKEGSTVKKDGTDAPKEAKTDTPDSKTGGSDDKGRNLTIGEKTDSSNAKNAETNAATGSNKPTDQKNDANKDGKNGTAKANAKGKNAKIAEAEKGVVDSIINQKSVTSMVDKGFALVKGVADLIGVDESSRVTQVIQGTVVKCGSKGTFISYGGTYNGYGSTPNVRNAVVEVVRTGNTNPQLPDKNQGGLAYIYGGTFNAYSGANVFNIVRQNASQQRIQLTKDSGGKMKMQVLTLKESETMNMEQLYYENQEAVAADSSVEPIQISTKNIQVRGGSFRCYFDLFNLGAAAEGSAFTRFAGTYGAVNLGVESFGEDLIRDGRIQITDSYGDGCLVLMDDTRDKETGLFHYRLYCSDRELRYKRFLTVAPNTDHTNSTYSLRLATYYGDGAQGDITQAWETTNDNPRDAAYAYDEKYFEFPINGYITNTTYVSPQFDDVQAQGETLASSKVWFYPKPRTTTGGTVKEVAWGNTFAQGRKTDGSSLFVSQWKKSDGDWSYALKNANTSTVNYSQTVYSKFQDKIWWFRYRIYRVDPLTKSSISESKVYGSDVPLGEVVYGANEESLKCILNLKSIEAQLKGKAKLRDGSTWQGYRRGEIYRIVFNVDEQLWYGYAGTAGSYMGKLDPAGAETSVMFTCYEVNEKSNDGSVGSEYIDTEYTPLQWVNEPKPGETAKIELRNAFAGKVDYQGNGNKIFDLYYQWWEVDAAGKDVRLLAGTDHVFNASNKDPAKNLANKWKHTPDNWNLGASIGADGKAKNGKTYLNTVNPNDPNLSALDANGLPKDHSAWTPEQLHLYSRELCSKDAAYLNEDRSKPNSPQNNDVFKTNADTCYIPESLAGKRVRVKVIAQNVRWVKSYDKTQVFYSHIIDVGGASIHGKAAWNGPVDVGYPAAVAVTGEAADLDLFYTWQRASSDAPDAAWTNINIPSSHTYTPTNNDIGKYLRCRVSVQGLYGELYTSAKYIDKRGLDERDAANRPNVPSCSKYTTSKIKVSNGQTKQEYIVLSTRKDAKNLTAGDWANATAGKSGTMYLDAASQEGMNYVYTRIKATDTTRPSVTVTSAKVFLGTEVALQDVTLSVKEVVYSGGSASTKSLVERNREFYVLNNGTVGNDKSGSVIELTVTPVPANATGFEGILGSKWICDGNSNGAYYQVANYGRFYRDIDCTMSLNYNEYYTKAYFRLNTSYDKFPDFLQGRKTAEFSVEYTKGYNDIARDFIWLNTAFASQGIPLRNLATIPFTGSVGVGEKNAELKFSLTASPYGAAVGALTVKPASDALDSGLVVKSFNSETGVMTVDASNAVPGLYTYDFYDGATHVGGCEIRVYGDEAAVRFANGYGYSTGGETPPLTVKLGEPFELPECGFNPIDGYEFDRWDLGKAGAKISVGKDTLVTAQWKKHEHSLAAMPELAATCLAEGMAAHYKCDTCGKLFLTADAAEAVSSESLKTEKTAHTPVTVAKVSATCVSKGCTAKKVCSFCGKVISGGKEIDFADHKYVSTAKIEPTCASVGHEAGTRCSVCGKYKSGGKEIAKKAHTFKKTVNVPSTCATQGETRSVCTVCSYAVEKTLPLAAHKYVNKVTAKATLTKDGKLTPTCSVCGKTKAAVKVYKASKITLSKTKFVYNGKAQKPTLSVKNSAGKAINSKYYTAKWSNKSAKAPGRYTVTVTLKTRYSGKKVLTYTIAPKQVTGVKRAASTTKSIKLSWTKATGAKYYDVYGSLDGKTFKKISTVTANTLNVTKVNGKALAAGRTYWFKVRALDASKKAVGAFSKVLKTGTKTAAPKITKLTSTKSKTATVTWGKVTGAKSYVVYKSLDGKKWTKAGTTTGTSFTLTKLTGGKRIYVKVLAVNAYKANSAFSAVKYVTVKK